MTILQPPGWPRPNGYANGTKAKGEMVFVAGQIGWNAKRKQFESDDLAAQVRQALTNVVAVLSAAGARAENVVRMTWYVTDMDEYRAHTKAIGAAYREVMGGHYPAMTLVNVVALVERRAKVEIEVTAVIPERAGGAD